MDMARVFVFLCFSLPKKKQIKKFKELKFRALIWSPIPIAIKKKNPKLHISAHAILNSTTNKKNK